MGRKKGGGGGGKGSGGGGGCGKGDSGGGSVTESNRIHFRKILDDFRASKDEVYTFEPGLSNEERAQLHVLCRKMGMISKSSGKGAERRLSVYKTKKQQGTTKNDEIITRLKFSRDCKNILQDLFIRYPPDDGELGEGKLSTCEKAAEFPIKPNSAFLKPKMHKSDIAKRVEMYSNKINEDTSLKKITEDRAKLPISSFKDIITTTLENHQVALVSGETGCGKTTQVPQYILDYMWDKGEACKIVCTQPRRISAISVAERIAYERGETIGETIGYKIRLEAKGGRQSSIMFCTNGILLRMLISRGGNKSKEEDAKTSLKDGLRGITHIIVDEIHERDRYSDFMLAILRDLLPSFPHLRIVLMSATIDAERFSEYFSGCPIVRVPGFTFSVKIFYLEDVLNIVKEGNNHLKVADTGSLEDDAELTEDYRIALDESIDLALSNDELDPLLELVTNKPIPKVYNYQHSVSGISPLMVLSGKGKVDDVCMLLSLGVDCSLSAKDRSTALNWAQRENQQVVYEVIRNHVQKDASRTAEEQELIDKYLSSINPELIDPALIKRLLMKICQDSNEGAILVFLAGWDDINQTRETLLSSPFFRDASKFVIYSLHSMIPTAEQKKVFKRPPRGVRKIILSTNIAETAVTIDDVVYVIDSGRVKEKSYDPYNNVSTLHSSWISKASAKQREGRAGRCQPGICYHLYSKIRAKSLLDYQIPEIKRIPVEELCLQIKLLDSHIRVVDFLKKTLDPPVPETILNAISILKDIGALTQDESLTDLGEKLGFLPVHPSTGKMLLFAILMNCLEPALILACAADYKEPFILPLAPEERKRAASAKAELISLYGGYSDQLAVLAAFECWRRAKDRGQENEFCSRYFVSSGTMKMLDGMRKQLHNELAKIGFIPDDSSSCSLNAGDPGIIRALIVSGSYPMVGRLLAPRQQNKRPIVETASGAKVRLHFNSCNYRVCSDKSLGGQLMVYDEITRGDTGVYVRNTSLIGLSPLFLLATEMVVAPANEDDENDEDTEGFSDEDDELDLVASSSGRHAQNIMSSPDNIVAVVVDRWLKFESEALDAAQIYCLRERLSEAMLFKVKNPGRVLPPALGASLYAIACILSDDGLSFLAAADKSGEENATCKFAKNGQNSSDFLRSLLSDNKQTSSPHFRKVRAPPLSGANLVISPQKGVATQSGSSKRPRGSGQISKAK